MIRLGSARWTLFWLIQSHLISKCSYICTYAKSLLPCCFSGTRLWLTLCHSMDYRAPSFSVFPCLVLEFAQTHVLWVDDAIQPSHPVVPFSSCPQSFPAAGSFPMSWLFSSGGQNIGTSTSTPVLPMNIQGGSPLGLTGLISLQSKGCWKVIFSTTVQKH